MLKRPNFDTKHFIKWNNNEKANLCYNCFVYSCYIRCNNISSASNALTRSICCINTNRSLRAISLHFLNKRLGTLFSQCLAHLTREKIIVRVFILSGGFRFWWERIIITQQWRVTSGYVANGVIAKGHLYAVAMLSSSHADGDVKNINIFVFLLYLLRVADCFNFNVFNM